MPNVIKSATTVSNGTIKRNNFLIGVNTSVDYGPTFLPGSKDTSFNIGTGFDSVVYSTAIQSDGKIIVGGLFTTFTGSSQNYLIRLNSDGSKDSTFNIGTGFDSFVYSTSIQSDGKILAGGGFTTYTGSSQNYLIRLNSNGSKDTSFNIGTGFDNTLFTTSIQSDGKILVGGVFSTFTGSSQNYLIRLNSDGSKDSTFNIGTGFDGFVYSTAIQSDGKILVGGGFSTYTGSSQNRLIRLNSDGSKDTSFNIGTGFGTAGQGVYSIAIQSDGKILAGGGFTTFTGSTQNKLIRLNSDGSKDTSFNIGTGFNGDVQSVSIQSGGKILVGGVFTTFAGSSENYLIRLNSDGSKDTSFNIGTGFDSFVSSTSIQSDGKILVGGGFTTFTGSSQNYLIRLGASGTEFWSGIVPTTNGYTVYAQKESQGPSIRTASNDSELITIATQYGGTGIVTVNNALNYFNSQSNFLVTNIDYEDIITDGLALLLDAGYVPSYPRSGTTWSDLSGNGFFATTQGTVPFTSAGGLSYFTFNGTAGNYFLGNSSLGSVVTGTLGVTVSSIFSTSDVSVRSTMFSNYTTQGGYSLECGTASGLWTNTLRSFIASNTSSDRRGTTSVLSNNVIYIMTVTWNQVTKVATLYLNGSEISSSEVSSPSTLNTVWANPSGALFEIGAVTFFSLYATGNIYKTMVYNRPLSSTEILRNYNAQKSRFGI